MAEVARESFESSAAPNFTGSQILLLPALYGLFRACLSPRLWIICTTLVIFAGVVLPLQKPALVTALIGVTMSVVGLVLVAWKNRFASAQFSISRTIVVAASTISVLVVGFGAWVSAGDGIGKKYLEERFLKVNYTGFDRDISSGREEIWTWAAHEFIKSPIWGQGLGNMYEVAASRSEVTIRATHNEYLEILQSGGLIAFIPYMALLVVSVKAQLDVLIRAPAFFVPAAGAVFAWSSAMLLSNMYGSVTSVQSAAFVYWGIFACSFALSRQSRYWWKDVQNG